MSSPDGSTVIFRRSPPDFRRRTIEGFARRLQDEVAKGQPFDCLITGDADLRRLNCAFRGQDYATDVLSFPTSQPAPHSGNLATSLASTRVQAREARTSLHTAPPPHLAGPAVSPARARVQHEVQTSFPTGQPAPHLGDLAISLARARVQAREFGHAVEHEVQILMLHGLLHLLGMDHETDRGQMARAEKRWRTRLGLSTSLIERVRA